MDERWFGRVAELARRTPPSYLLLEPAAAELRDKRRDFEARHYEGTVSLYPAAGVAARLRAVEAGLEQLRGEIDGEAAAVVRALYADYLDEQLAEIRLVTAAAAKDDAGYARENLALYGEIDAEMFGAAVAWIRAEAVQAEARGSAALRRRAAAVLAWLPAGHGEYHRLIPQEALFADIRARHRQPGGYLERLFGGAAPEPGTTITTAEGDAICRRVLTNIGADFVIAPSPNNTWGVDQAGGRLLRPDYRLTGAEFTGLVCHEIGSHILEAVNGRHQPLRLMGLGLAGYEKGNEGRAFLREQIIYESEHAFLRTRAWEYTVLLHVGVGLANGAAGQPFTFAQIYAAAYGLYAFWREQRQPGDPGNEAWSRDKAWYLGVRLFKGTPGAGGSYRRDQIYLEGNVKCWQAAARNPDIILWGDCGKFDITNEAQVEAVKKIAPLKHTP